MLDTVIKYSVDSLGLLPLMALILLIGIAIIIERLMFFGRTIKAGYSLEYDLQHVKPGMRDDAQKVADHYSDCFQGELVRTALTGEGRPEAALERDIEETIMFQLPKLDRNLWILDTAVTLGPLLGLLGTILGMVESFNVLGTSGTGNPTAVTGGIGHALIATACGLTIAIICVVFLNYFNKRIRLAVNQLDLIKSMLVSRFAHGAAAAAH